MRRSHPGNVQPCLQKRNLDNGMHRPKIEATEAVFRNF